MDTNDQGKSSTGLNANVAGLICYAFGWITGLIFLLLEKENKFVRFHALQSLIVFGSITLLPLVCLPLLFAVPGALMVVTPFLPLFAIGQFVIWVICMIKAYQGEHFKLPVVGNIAERFS